MPYKDATQQKLAQHDSYLRNKAKVRQRSKDRRKARKEWYLEFMQDKSCSACSETETACLDWHHLDPSVKDGEISTMIGEMRPMDRIFEEMAKCLILCANCHRKLHATLRG
jgi:hypothetical protein